MFLTSYKLPAKDERPMPLFVRFSFGLFVLILITTGSALVMKTPNIFPWPLSEELRVMYGWIFLGAMLYFLYAAYKSKWVFAQGPLMGFLAYDLVLILPFVLHFADVLPEQRLSLSIYVSAIIFSALVAIYFLFIHKDTRFGSQAPY
jgi:heme/copper-type cytochrome/quinol oxidase subunit 4